MALYYLDTSAVVKLYIREPGTARLLRLTTPAANHRFAVLALAQVEFRTAVRRRQRAGDIPESMATALIERFGQHLEAKFLRQSLSEVVIEIACRLADRRPLRAYDAMQLAGALILRAAVAPEQPIFTCADTNLVHAAEAEGLAVLNPT